MRQIISEGTLLLLRRETTLCKFVVVRFIGDGANCLVYEGVRLDGAAAGARCRIKECYPSGVEIRRENDEIIWMHEDEKTNAFNRFRNAHEMLIRLGNEDTIGNSVISSELFEGNGTLYSVMSMNYGDVDYANENASLSDVIEEVRVLSDVIGYLHGLGYLHLDIKPENYIVTRNPNTGIWFFDMDSVVSIDDIQSGRVCDISFTRRYAAMELRSGLLNHVCKATDVYAIGAVLFEKIMNRPVSDEDEWPGAEWPLKGELFSKVNPKVRKQLQEIFSKTLSINWKRRFQSVGELSAALQKVIALAKEPCFLRSNIPSVTELFLDRDDRIKAIESAFSSGQRMVFIHGMPGIGKSELAKRFAALYKQNYDVVLFSNYTGSVDELFASVTIENFEGKRTEKKPILLRLLNQKVLWIIDGVNAIDYNGLGELEQLQCHLLITGTIKWDEYLRGKPCFLDQLPEEYAFQLFEHAYGRPLLNDNAKIARQIVRAIGYHTLLILLLAKQIGAGIRTLAETLEAIEQKGVIATSGEQIIYVKDDVWYETELKAILKDVFDVEGFKRDDQASGVKATILRSLAMIYPIKVEKRAFARWMGLDECKYINQLIQSYWLNEDVVNGVSYIGLHAIIADVVASNLGYSVERCLQLCLQIKHYADAFANKYKTATEERFLVYGNESIFGVDQERHDVFLALVSQVLKKSSITEVNDVRFWVQIIESIVAWSDAHSIHICGISEYVEKIWHDHWIRTQIGSDCESKLASVMGILALGKTDFSEAGRYLVWSVELAEGLACKNEILFRNCFMGYIALHNLFFADHSLRRKKDCIFLINSLKEMWCDLADCEESQLARIPIVSATSRKIHSLTKQALQRIYADYLRVGYGIDSEVEHLDLESDADAKPRMSAAEQAAIGCHVYNCKRLMEVLSSEVVVNLPKRTLSIHQPIIREKRQVIQETVEGIVISTRNGQLAEDANYLYYRNVADECALFLVAYKLIGDKQNTEKYLSQLMWCDMHAAVAQAQECTHVEYPGGFDFPGWEWIKALEDTYLSKEEAFLYFDELICQIKHSLENKEIDENVLYYLFSNAMMFAHSMGDNRIAEHCRAQMKILSSPFWGTA